MGTRLAAPGPQQNRLAAYLEGLAQAVGHADRAGPLKSYCTGLLLPGERKRVEPMAARLAPGNVARMHQSLHHLVAGAPWDDGALLARVPSSRRTLHRRLWVPDRREGPFIPLSTSRPTGHIRAASSVELRATEPPDGIATAGVS